MQEKPVVSNVAVKEHWTAFSDIYQHFDSTMQTFYYTLLHMMNIKEANSILEIACGTGKLLPLALTLKKQSASYVATDLVQEMVDKSKDTLKEHFKKWNSGSQDKFEEWIKHQKIQLFAADGEGEIDTKLKFDRIICNLVIMITENPEKMLLNLRNYAEEGCIMGVTIWGEKALSNFIPMTGEVMKELGMEVANKRTNFHLYNRLPELAEKTGWDILLIWEQNSPFNFYQYNTTLDRLVTEFAAGNAQVAEICKQRVQKIFQQKKTLNFPVQMAILRKK